MLLLSFANTLVESASGQAVHVVDQFFPASLIYDPLHPGFRSVDSLAWHWQVQADASLFLARFDRPIKLAPCFCQISASSTKIWYLKPLWNPASSSCTLFWPQSRPQSPYSCAAVGSCSLLDHARLLFIAILRGVSASAVVMLTGTTVGTAALSAGLVRSLRLPFPHKQPHGVVWRHASTFPTSASGGEGTLTARTSYNMLGVPTLSHLRSLASSTLLSF